MPKYNELRAADRRNLEFYGDYHRPEEPVERATSRDLTARERKNLNMNSQLWDSGFATQAPAPAQKAPAHFSPERRRDEMLSSNVFGNSPYKYERPPVEKENAEARRKNHMYSDLFTEPQAERPRVEQRMQPTSDHWLQDRSGGQNWQ